MQTQVLIVDDDYSVTASLALVLKQAGYAPRTASTPAEALAILSEEGVDLVLQDMNFSRLTTGEEGLRLLGDIKKLRPGLPVVLITAWGSIDLAVAGMKAGASDFITKPWKNEQILHVVRNSLDLAGGRSVLSTSTPPDREELDSRFDFSGIIGNSLKLRETLDLVGRIAPTDAPVLLTGESGTGKEVVAEAIHRNSPRAAGPMVKVNLGGIPTSLFESEMFGHLRGAFTDAHRDRQGRFAAADGGSIFLDEIGELDPRDQVKLLRVLQDRTYEVLGSSQTRTLDVRIVSASNRNLNRCVDEGSFREDLFYRLNLIHVHLPPLAERREDIPLLARYFAARLRRSEGASPITLSEAALDWLRTQRWPGNIRQLKHVIERTVLITRSPFLKPEDFQANMAHELKESEDIGRRPGGSASTLPPVGAMTMETIEKEMILKSLGHHGGNLTRTAASLGLSRAALYRRLQKYGIKP